MAKQGMARPDWTKTHPRNGAPAVPQIQGAAKSGKEKAKPIVAGTEGPEMRVYHPQPAAREVYSAIDNDLARDNLENDIPIPDLPD